MRLDGDDFRLPGLLSAIRISPKVCALDQAYAASAMGALVESVIVAAGVLKGYLHRPELNGQTLFISNPWRRRTLRKPVTWLGLAFRRRVEIFSPPMTSTIKFVDSSGKRRTSIANIQRVMVCGSV